MIFFLDCFQTDTFLVSLWFAFLFHPPFKLVFIPDLVLKEYPPYLLNLPMSSITVPITNLIRLLRKELLFLSDIIFQSCHGTSQAQNGRGDTLSSFTASRYCLRNG